MPGLYQGDDYDLAGFAVGAVERGEILPRRDIAEGDVIIGLASSGVHSNGFSLVRKIVAKTGLPWSAPAPFAPGQTHPSVSLGEAILTPTRIYVKSCLAAIRTTKAVKGLAHLTGGGFPDNIPRVLPKDLGARIDLKQVPVPPVFKWLAREGGIAESEMLRTFNCGIGMIAIAAPKDADAVTQAFHDAGETAVTIGNVVRASGDARVVYDGKLDLELVTHEPQARRRSDFRPRLQYGGADRGGEGQSLSSRDRAGAVEPAGCRRPWWSRARPASPPKSIDHTAFGKDRAAFDAALQAVLEKHDIDIVCLAGFMRLLTPGFVAQWPSACSISIPRCCRPSRGSIRTSAHLRPARRCMAPRCISSSAEMDSGPIIVQGAVAVRDNDDRSGACRARARGRAPDLSIGAQTIGGRPRSRRQRPLPDRRRAGSRRGIACPSNPEFFAHSIVNIVGARRCYNSDAGDATKTGGR